MCTSLGKVATSLGNKHYQFGEMVLPVWGNSIKKSFLNSDLTFILLMINKYIVDIKKALLLKVLFNKTTYR